VDRPSRAARVATVQDARPDPAAAGASRPLWIAVLVVAVAYIGVALPYPILAPLFLGDTGTALLHGQWFRLSPHVALGLTLAIYPIGMFFGSQLLGSWSDRFGRRPVLIGSLVGAGAGYLVSALALTQDDLTLLIAGRLVTGLCEGNVPIARAIAADLSTHVPKNVSFGYLGAAVYAGYLIGPLLGGFLVLWSDVAPFHVAALLNLTVAGVAALLLRETRRTEAGSDTAAANAETTSNLQLLRDPVMARLFLANWLVALAVAAFYQFYPVLMFERWHSDSRMIAYATAAVTVALMVSSLVLVKWSARRTSLRVIVTVSGLLLAVLLALFSLPTELAWIWLTFPLIGLAIPMTTTPLTIYTSNQASALHQGRLMGLLGSAGALGSSVIILAGSYFSQFDVRAPMVCGGLMAAFSIAVFARTAWQRRTATASI
jgi:DHA1 family tetracycline resistance protein-like MFS transporter